MQLIASASFALRYFTPTILASPLNRPPHPCPTPYPHRQVQLSPFCLFHAHMFLAPPHPDELNDNLDHNHYNHNGHNVKQHSAALHTLHRFSHHAHSDRGHGPGPAPDPTQIGTCLLTNGQGNAYPVTGDSGNCRGNDNADAHNNIDGRHGPGFTGSGEGRRGGAHDGGGGGSGRHVGLLFHACEYPAFHPERFPYPLGHCQADSDLQHSGQAMAQRNVLWYQVGWGGGGVRACVLRCVGVCMLFRGLGERPIGEACCGAMCVCARAVAILVTNLRGATQNPTPHPLGLRGVTGRASRQPPQHLSP